MTKMTEANPDLLPQCFHLKELSKMDNSYLKLPATCICYCLKQGQPRTEVIKVIDLICSLWFGKKGRESGQSRTFYEALRE
jgi:hypothetical protein